MLCLAVPKGTVSQNGLAVLDNSKFDLSLK